MLTLALLGSLLANGYCLLGCGLTLSLSLSLSSPVFLPPWVILSLPLKHLLPLTCFIIYPVCLSLCMEEYCGTKNEECIRHIHTERVYHRAMNDVHTNMPRVYHRAINDVHTKHAHIHPYTLMPFRLTKKNHKTKPLNINYKQPSSENCNNTYRRACVRPYTHYTHTIPLYPHIHIAYSITSF